MEVELLFRPDPVAYRCLVLPGDAGTAWLVGEPADLADRLARLEREARTDALTGLGNRRQADSWLDDALRGQGELACLIADLDQFKAINDAFGHEAGDLVLRSVGSVFIDTIGQAGQVARPGGDEFLLVLPGADLALASEAAERLRRAVEGLAVAPVPRGAIRTSLGVACRREGDDAAALRGRADRALLRAKRGGRNRVELGLDQGLGLTDLGVRDGDGGGSGP